jgi:hypothetical protein
MNIFNLFVHDMLVEAWFAESQISDDLVGEVIEILTDRLVTQIAIQLSDDDKIAFLDMTESNKSSEAFAFAQTKIPHYQDFFAKVLASFKEEYLRDMGR